MEYAVIVAIDENKVLERYAVVREKTGHVSYFRKDTVDATWVPYSCYKHGCPWCKKPLFTEY